MSNDLSNKLLIELNRLFTPTKIDKISKMGKMTVNTLYHFKAKSKDYIAKILTRPATSENEIHRLKKEVHFFKHFKNLGKMKGINSKQRILVPVPEVIHYEDNEDSIGFKYYIMEKIPGESLEEKWETLSQEQKDNLSKDFANIIQGIHSITFDLFGEIEEYDCPRQFYTMQNMIKADARRSARLIGINKLLPTKLVTNSLVLIEDLVDKSNFTNIPKLIHGDLNPSNIIIEKLDDQYKINAILDFEWAYAGDPLFDLFDINNEFSYDLNFCKLFYKNYSNELYTDLSNYIVEKQIHKILSLLNTVAFGWVYFHPTSENLGWIQKELELALNKTL